MQMFPPYTIDTKGELEVGNRGESIFFGQYRAVSGVRAVNTYERNGGPSLARKRGDERGVLVCLYLWRERDRQASVLLLL